MESAADDTQGTLPPRRIARSSSSVNPEGNVTVPVIENSRGDENFMAESLPTNPAFIRSRESFQYNQGIAMPFLPAEKEARSWRRPMRRGHIFSTEDNNMIDAHTGRDQYMRREQLKKERPTRTNRARWTIDNTPTSFRHWLIYHVEGRRFGNFYSLFNGIIDSGFCIIYIVERCLWTPQFLPYILLVPRPFGLWVTLIIMSYIAVALYLLRLYTSLQWRMIISPYFIIDLLTSFPFIMSTFFPDGSFWYVPYFLRCWTAFHHFLQYRRISTQLKEGYSYDQLREQIIALVTVVIGIFFSGVSAINYVECAFGDTAMNFFVSIYLIVITASTVGYGDVVPTTLAGRIVIIIFILIAITVLPIQIASLLEATRLHRDGGGRHVQYTGRHVVITGAFSSDTHVLDYLNEFFHIEALRNKYRVVFLSSTELSSSVSMILSSPFFRSRVTYLIGSPLSAYDLKRANVQHASAVFVISNRFTDAVKDADALNVLHVWALQNTIETDRIFVSNVYPDSAVFLYFTDKAIYIDEIGKALLALNTLHRGSSTLILNLLHIYAPPTVAPTTWEGEYGDGAGNELYMTQLPATFVGMPITAVAWMLFEYFQVTLFAVCVHPDGEAAPGLILLNPGKNYILQASDECFFLAQDKQDMKDIRNFNAANHPEFDEKRKLYMNTVREVHSPSVDDNNNGNHDNNGGDSTQSRSKERGANARNPASLRRPSASPKAAERSLMQHARNRLNKNRLEVMENSSSSMDEIGKVKRGPSLERIGSAATARLVLSENESSTVSSSFFDDDDVPVNDNDNDNDDGLWCGNQRARFPTDSSNSSGYAANAVPLHATYMSGNRGDAEIGYPDIFSKGGVALSWLLEHPTFVDDSTVSDAKFLESEPFVLLLTETFELFTLIQLLRGANLPRRQLKPIVIMAKDPPSQAQWNVFSIFPEVYFIQGWMAREYDLLRSGIMYAETILLVTSNRAINDHMIIDYHAILLCEKIHSMRVDCPLISELHSRKNLQFAWPRTHKFAADMPYVFSPAYAAGQVIALSMIDSLLFRAFHAHFLFSLVRHLLGLKDENNEKQVAALGYKSGCYCTMKLPARYVGRTFGSLFHHMTLREGKIPIAVYRAHMEESRGNLLPYIYTNPLAETVLDAEDVIHYIA